MQIHAQPRYIRNVINKSATKASIRFGFPSPVHLSTLILTNTPNATSSPHVFVEAITNETFSTSFKTAGAKKCKTDRCSSRDLLSALAKVSLTTREAFPSHPTGEHRRSRRFQVNMSFAVNSFGEIFRSRAHLLRFNDSWKLFFRFCS